MEYDTLKQVIKGVIMNNPVEEGYLGIVDRSMSGKKIDTYPGETDDILKKIKESGEISVYKDLRPSKDTYYLDIAIAVSKRSTCLKRHYGAVIVNNDEIISTGYNGNPRGMFNCCQKLTCSRIDKPHNSGDYSDCFSVHAEQNALLSASRRDMIGGILYLVCEEYGLDKEKSGKYQEDFYGFNEITEDVSPCPICMRMIQNSGIKKIVTRGDIKCL